jgi:glycosyltransferase involved in cell wall biosynthesis
MSVPKVLYIARTDFGGGAEQRLNLTAQHYEGTLGVYVKHNHHTWPKVKSFPVTFFDRIFGIINRFYYKYAKERVNIRTKLFLTEELNLTWSHLKRLPEFWACDVVHISNLHTNYFDLCALKNISKYKPVVLNVSDLWLLTGGEAYSPWDDGFKHGVATTNDISLYPLKSPWVDRRQSMMRKKRKLFIQLKDRLFYMTNSNWTETQFTSSWVMNFGPDYRTIIPGVNTHQYLNTGLRDWKRVRILCFYSRNRFKNHALIFEALAALGKPVDLYLIGENMPLVNNNVTITYLGKYISDAEKLAGIYNDIDVLLYPSIAETFGMMAAEAKSCGVCVIGSRQTAVAEQITDQKTGLLIDPTDSQQLTELLDWCAEHLNEVRTMGKAASEDIQHNYSFEKYMQETTRYYEYIVQKTKPV